MKYSLKFKKKTEVERLYDSIAEQYDRKRSESFEGRQVNRLQVNFIRKELRKISAKKILEAGCGTGRMLLPLAEEFECHGIDPAKNMLEQIKANAKKHSIKVNVKKGDIEKIPYKSNTFDAVFTVHVLMHLPRHDKAFKEMLRVVKSGGIVIMDFPNHESVWTKLSLLLSPGKKRTRLFKYKDLRNE